MGALLQKAVLLEKGNIWVGSTAGDVVDLGSVRKVRFTGKLVRQQIDSDNRGTILDHGRMNGEIDFDWLEPGSVSNMESMFKGLVTKTTVAGGDTAVTGEVTAAGSWAYNQIIFFANQMGDQTKNGTVTVTAGTDGLLVNVTDYDITQDPGSKKWGVSIKDSVTVTTLNQAITLTYHYTPNTAVVLTGGTSLTQTARYVKIVGPLETDGTKTRTIILSSAKVTSDMMLAFVDVETANDVGVMPVKVENDKAATWTWTDQVNPN